jgi:cytochrome c1
MNIRSLKFLDNKFKQYFFLLGIVFFVNNIDSAEGGPCKAYGDCDEFKYSLNDMESLQRGASTFLNYCYGCHSLQYSRWGRVATDLQIPEEIFFENLVFDKTIKPGDLMIGSMSKEKSAEWFGVAPPDLTLISRVRGDDWIYSYLRAYYEDSSKQYGVNNLVYPGTAMPNVLAALQGAQKLVCKDVPVIAKNGGEKRDDYGNTITKQKCGYLEVDEGSGELSKEQFDKLIYDLTNFLVYVGEPEKATRERMGWYVIFYFLIFTALSALLYREYHKDYYK